jgi:hypothetical protein
VETLVFSADIAVSDRAIIALARAIDARGLPKLEAFSMKEMAPDKVTVVGVSAIALATTKGCPNLQRFHLINSYPDEDTLREVRGMLEAVGRAGKVEVY